MELESSDKENLHFILCKNFHLNSLITPDQDKRSSIFVIYNIILELSYRNIGYCNVRDIHTQVHNTALALLLVQF